LSKFHPVFVGLARNKIVLCDAELLLLSVAVQLNHFHAIQQGWRNCIEDVSRGDKQDSREIKRHIEVVISEGMVRFRVQDFQKRGSRVAAKVRANLVDFVQHEYGITLSSTTDALNDLARQRADIGSPVPSDLSFIADAAE